MRKVLLVENVSDELIPEEYADSWGIQGKTIWATFEVTESDFQEYESLRLALQEKLDQIREVNR